MPKKGKGVEEDHSASKHSAEHHPCKHCGEHPMMQTSEEGADTRTAINADIRSYGTPPSRMPMDSIVQRR